VTDEAPFVHRSWYVNVGPLCCSVMLLLGWWVSLGAHVSLWPLYVDVHVLWLTFTVQSRARGVYLEGQDREWENFRQELIE